MAIPSRQIGWSTKSNLLWEISKQLEYLTGIVGRNIPTTTTTTTIYYYYYNAYSCDGSPIVYTIRSTISLSLSDVVLVDDSNCYTITSVVSGPSHYGDYVSNQVCFTDPCPTTTTTTTAVPSYSYFANYSTTSGPAACYQAQDQFQIYTPASIDVNVPVYTNDTLTTPAPDGWYSFSGAIYTVSGNNVTSIDSCPATNAYSYVISQIDLNASIGNTDTNLNGKIITSTTDDGSGSPSSRTFSSAGGYNHWMCSLASIVPTFGYWANDVFVTTGLISTQTNIGAC